MVIIMVPESKDDYIREEIEFQEFILDRTYSQWDDETKKLSYLKTLKFNEIWFTGSGDSYCASLFGEYLATKLQIKSKAFTPFDLSNFSPSFVEYPILVAISVSGKTPRVIEAVKKFKKLNTAATVIGLTDNPDSPLYIECNHPMLINASPAEMLEISNYSDPEAKKYTGYHHDVAQTKTYFANLLKILQILFVISNRDAQLLNKFKSDYKVINKNMEDLVLKNEILYPEKTIFVSSGIYRSLSKFIQYKWFEFTLPGLEQDVEEYAHTHYFTTDTRTSLVFIASSGPILQRVKELVKGALAELIKPQIIILSDTKVPDWGSLPNISWLNLLDSLTYQSTERKFQDIEFYFYALLCVEWYMYHTARKLGFKTNIFRGGVDTEKYVKGSLETIRKSRVQE
jgi:fructoselysine-6-P-deglycase FrlB-like protein